MKDATVRTESAERQDLVNRAFRACMSMDLRGLGDIRHIVREWIARGQCADWEPSDHQLQIMISRNAMGEGEWDFYPAYTNPPRYVSRARVLELSQKEVAEGLTMWEREELDGQLADLERGVAHWRAKHAAARRREAELDALIQRARHHPMACASVDGTP